MTTPNHPPLWDVMADAVINAPPPTNSPTGTIAAAQIRALHEAGFTDASGNWLPHFQPLEETND